MAVRFSCDGCGNMIPDGVKPKCIGTVLVRDYCGECAPHAEAYMKAVNAAHTEVAHEWEKRLNAIRDEYFVRGDLHALPDTDMVQPKPDAATAAAAVARRAERPEDGSP